MRCRLKGREGEGERVWFGGEDRTSTEDHGKEPATVGGGLPKTEVKAQMETDQRPLWLRDRGSASLS